MPPRSSSSFEEFANSLASEALSEAAENFFGRRVELERQEELLRRKAEELQRLAEQALDAAALLGALLLDEQEAVAFFRLVGLELDEAALSELFCTLRGRPLRLRSAFPRALTKASRYAKLLEAAYTQARQAFEEYRHGRVTQDTARGPKRMTLHYKQLEDWCDEHNCRVRDANASQAPSCVIGFCKQLVGDGERERILGGGAHGGCSIDDSMAIKPIDFASLQLPALPSLPDTPGLSAKIRDFGQALHSRRGEELAAVLPRIRH
ncbi:hypothetical protein [Megalodesulfovibrio paquesii]